jgi:hypothetical protein
MNTEKVENWIVYVGGTKMHINRHDNKLVTRVLSFEF